LVLSACPQGPRGVSAAIVGVPLKPPLLATMKSTNYMLNAHVAMEVGNQWG